MNKNDAFTEIFVFIARDDEEYEKYTLERGKNEDHGRMPMQGGIHTGFQWRFDAMSRILRLVINKGCLGQGGWERLRPPNTPADFKDPQRLAVLLERLRGADNEQDIIDTGLAAKIAVKDVFVGGAQNGNQWNGGLWSILQGLQDEDGNTILTGDIRSRIFIHWGGGEREQILFYERKVSELLPPNWKLFSLGTNRNDLFPVDGGSIKVPCGLQELQKLEEKFSGESDFEHIKEILTKYVVENGDWRKQNLGAENQTCVYRLTPSQARDLRSYLQSIATLKDNPLAVKLLAQCDALQDFLKGNQLALPSCHTGIIALFSLLVREGIRHG